MKIGILLSVGLLVAGLAACSGAKIEREYPAKIPGTSGGDPFYTVEKYKDQRIFGESGAQIGGKKQPGNLGIGVNTYLWQASLDTVSFMPLASADPFGGVIITDWFVNPDAPNERFKMTVLIRDTELTATGVKVNVYRQEFKDSRWIDAGVRKDTPVKIENAILTRAREIKIGENS